MTAGGEDGVVAGAGNGLLAHRLEGEGEPLLLLNGGLMSYAAWEPLSSRLRRSHRLILCDLRGQLLSPGPAPAELKGNVADLTTLLDHLGIDSAHVLGTSYGGEIGLLLAALAPRRVRSLVAVTVADHADGEMRRDGEEWRALLVAADDAESRGRFYARLLEAVYSDDFRRRFGGELAARGAEVAAMPETWWRELRTIFDAIATLDVRPHLDAIRCPTLVVVAGRDRLIPPSRSLALAAAIGGAETRVHETSGHALVAEDPRWLARVALDFLSRHSAPRGATAAASDPTPDRSGHLEAGPHRVWWEYFGDGEREAAVLLNGLAMHTQAWYGFLDDLRPEFDVLLYDYVGQGRSSCPDQPYRIPDCCHHLTGILDLLGIERIHVMGISYGGFIALDYGRLYQQRCHTLTLSGILLSHERQFEMYQDLSLLFYRSGAKAFEIYTHYLYEKIFGEEFLRAVPAETLETMRRRFHERYKDRVHALVRLTEAQGPFFDGLEERLDDYRAVETPVLLVAGSQDRVLPLWQQTKMLDVFPDIRYEPVEGAGHVVYLEKKEVFFPMLKAFMRAKTTDFELPGAAETARAAGR